MFTDSFAAHVIRLFTPLVCAVCILLGEAGAAAQTASEAASLTALHAALEQARFEQAEALAREFLGQTGLSARAHNDALELLAIVQIAQRNRIGASQTLKLLFDRDPQHPRRVSDPGPVVDAAFARARKALHEGPAVVLAGQTRRDAYGRDLLEVSLNSGAESVDRVHVFVRAERDAEFTEIVREPSVDDRVTALLPAPPLGSKAYHWYVDARAPSGLLLAQLASADAPNETARLIPARTTDRRCEAMKPEPLVHRWWLWTSIGVIVAGAAITGAVVAQ